MTFLLEGAQYALSNSSKMELCVKTVFLSCTPHTPCQNKIKISNHQNLSNYPISLKRSDISDVFMEFHQYYTFNLCCLA